MAKIYLSLFFLVAAMAVVIGAVIVAPIDPSLHLVICLVFVACFFLSIVFWDKSMDEK